MLKFLRILILFSNAWFSTLHDTYQMLIQMLCTYLNKHSSCIILIVPATNFLKISLNYVAIFKWISFVANHEQLAEKIITPLYSSNNVLVLFTANANCKRRLDKRATDWQPRNKLYHEECPFQLQVTEMVY